MSVTLVVISGSGNRVFIKPDTNPVSKRDSGLVVVKQGQGDDSRPNEGIVLNVSDFDQNDKKPVVQVGDRVLYSMFAGVEQNFRGETFLVMKETDIQAIIKED